MAHTASYSVDAGVPYLGEEVWGQVAGVWSGVNHSPPCSAVFKNDRNCTSTAPIYFYGMDRETLPFWYIKEIKTASLQCSLIAISAFSCFLHGRIDKRVWAILNCSICKLRNILTPFISFSYPKTIKLVGICIRHKTFVLSFSTTSVRNIFHIGKHLVCYAGDVCRNIGP